MQDALALLSAALDSSGYICIRGFGVGPNKGDPAFRRQRIFKPGQYQQAVDYARRIDAQGIDTYYTTATLNNTSNAEATNVHAVKLFKVDLDIDQNDPKKYPTRSIAGAALQVWCQTNGVPEPNWWVNSGYGLHAYFILSDALNAEDGKEYSDKIKALLMHAQIKFDQGITGDIARVLRLPGTVNRKHPPAAKPVKLLSSGPDIDTDTMLDALDLLWANTPSLPVVAKVAAPPSLGLGHVPAHLQGVTLSDDTKSLFVHRPKSFAVLVDRSTTTTDLGCNQVKHLYENQQMQSEPEWRAILSIAHFCDDGPTAIHATSNKHPGYDYDATEAKASHIKGPYTCNQFEMNWPVRCQGCPHKGKIGSPIALGDYVKLMEGPTTVMAKNAKVDDQEVQYDIPEYPDPYVRGADGGVYRRNYKDPANPEAVLEGADLYVVDRLKSEEDGAMYQLRYIHARDGVAEFILKGTRLGAKELGEDLRFYGINVFDKGVTSVRNYITAWIESLKMQRDVCMVRTQMGWTDDYKSFIIGDREVTAGGTLYSRAAPSLTAVTDALQKKGEFNVWRRTFSTYAMPGFEAYAFCALVGFGAPLMPLFNLHGMVLNAYAEKSGTGKTTTLDAALSIWGEPEGLRLTCGKEHGDTVNSRFNRMGQYKNLPICIDEVTKMTVEEMQQFLLSLTGGRAKHRMMASANQERVNNATWASICLTSANTSFIEALQVEKVGVQGELMRILEVHLPPQNVLSKADSDRIFKNFNEHYGLAGQSYIAYLLRNWERVLPLLEEERSNLDKRTGAAQDERYWSATCACIIVGGRLAKEDGLHDIDMDAMRDFAVRLIIDTRARHHYGNTVNGKRSDLLGDFLNENLFGTLVVQVNMVNNKPVSTAIKEPTNSLHVRYEKNLGKLFVTQSHFNKFMRDRNANIDQYLKELKATGQYHADTQKRMASGTSLPNNPVRVYEFNMKDDDLPPLIT